VRLREGRKPAVGELPLNQQGRIRLVEITSFEGDPFLGTKPCLGGHDHKRPESWPKFGRQRLDLFRFERPQLFRSRLGIPARFGDRVARDVTPTDGRAQGLPEGRSKPVAG
jgi:hypothetical protein